MNLADIGAHFRRIALASPCARFPDILDPAHWFRIEARGRAWSVGLTINR